ncbi:hypothetical protein PP499_gp52 [Gordonia phage Bjanes7]|uniref:Uncharacterized protein n=6 Tax=Caudoviricetes TaxID=2731619 RepID=A0A7T3KBM5_9CAUD|nr:hypothetical protein PP486_gp56 [Gordonia phage Bosnia]YP_010653333.1 hypothetical protein PP492_gp58 [Gordonia phage Ohgeesy]YP_010653697.1 hypothetical protein PP497_gp51 [Gordonia phage Lamberg]YP_010653771.1 hypothetical protein PP498_gp54 [Gordonia phage Sahara]YP_010653841.1 hypothetical protein PP499_gp52 [Gordonia phage Bjanes7]YP_010653920.1 exonuclease [Gordonia phage Ebert]AZS12796.1 hypothetical protein SEA_SPROUTIE_55 [Gordonia phage Sproutie]AZS12870.1 hypothetical protein S
MTVTVRIAWPKLGESELERISNQLDSDGFASAAAAYRGRIADAKSSYKEASRAADHLRDIDRAAKDVARDHPDVLHGDIGSDHGTDRGKALASWLVQQGWTPPHSMSGLVVVQE